MDKLNFLTAGVPLKAEGKGYEVGFKVLDDMNLDGLELEFVRGVRISDKSREAVGNSKKVITAHAPFYVNLNAREEEKVEAEIIIEASAEAPVEEVVPEKPKRGRKPKKKENEE